MTDDIYFKGVNNLKEFSREELLKSFRLGGYQLSEVSFYKNLKNMVNFGEIVRIGRNRYCMSDNQKREYSYDYSSLAKEVASSIEEHYPYLAFSIFELVQMNDFLNHLIAHNVIFLSVEVDALESIFEYLKIKYPGKVLINPTLDIYNHYWSDDMIVILKLTTEAPKGKIKLWHTRLEKLLVDIMSEPLIKESISEVEYPRIYTDSFDRYYIDQSCLFRYANRRKITFKIKKLIHDKTEIILNEKK